MVEGIRELIERTEPDQAAADRIVQILVDAGFEDASDVACVTPRMATRFFENEAVLLESFQRAVVAAGAVLEGWVANVGCEVRTLGVGAVGGVRPWPCPPFRPALAPGEPPVSCRLRGVRSGLGGSERHVN